MSQRLIPRKAVPNLKVPLLSGGEWDLSSQSAEKFFLIVFYRGYHCPICRPYIRELQQNLNGFAERGVTSLALSSDSQERAALTAKEWGLPNSFPLGYGLSIEDARQWGLYVSTSRGKTSTGVMEPDLFSEPGLFLLRADKTLYASIIHTMPFARPSFAQLLKNLDFIIEKDYPARGEA